MNMILYVMVFYFYVFGIWMHDGIFRKIYANNIITENRNLTLKQVVILKMMFDPQELRTTTCS